MRAIRFVLALALVFAGIGCGSGDGGDNAIRFWQFWDMAIIEPIIDRVRQP